MKGKVARPEALAPLMPPLQLPLEVYVSFELAGQVTVVDSSTVQIELRLLSLESEAVFIPKMEP